mmetsp:Transcript_25874/g.102033  ORF Transcript_25874/g.102033 Transcript_25874/m.102033 type:complete len:83 (+) Transcript_25874:517-765(+)
MRAHRLRRSRLVQIRTVTRGAVPLQPPGVTLLHKEAEEVCSIMTDLRQQQAEGPHQPVERVSTCHLPREVWELRTLRLRIVG